MSATERQKMNDPMASIRDAAKTSGEQFMRQHIRAITEDRDRRKKEARIAWICFAVACAILAVAASQ